MLGVSLFPRTSDTRRAHCSLGERSLLSSPEDSTCSFARCGDLGWPGRARSQSSHGSKGPGCVAQPASDGHGPLTTRGPPTATCMSRASTESAGAQSDLTLCVAGTRSFMAGGPFTDVQRSRVVRDALYSEFPDEVVESIGRVVSGGARGGDRAGEAYAERCDLELTVIEPDWEDTSGPDAVVKQHDDGSEYNAKAGFERNSELVVEADVVLAFWDGDSRGTLDTIDKARDRLDRDRVAVVRYDQL